jgi:DNA-binding NtrC family response regulator
VAINCGAIQPTLIESELFGHTSGSFTGASRARKGVFEQAQSGTLFLDEITEMSTDLQVKLLRVLETRTIQRVGAEKPVEVDVRLIASTNRPSETLVENGALREDLFYRLNVFPIRVPPLRDRDGDVRLLAGFFLDELNEQSEESKRFDPTALDALGRHDWPGNVRELRNVVERAFILAADVVLPEHFALQSGAPAASAGGVEIGIGTTIAEAERRLILATLEHLDGDKKRAAEALGISLKTLYNRLNTYGLGRRGKKKKRKARSH